ncbi:hypothetical protein H7097_00600 [Aeromicrobium sp.]|nr:hypothetical protein [Candidatus Saccharibacteria bacterium]
MRFSSGELRPQGQPLTSEQLSALETGPGLVMDPVFDEIMSAETSIATLQAGYASLGNFSAYFESPTSFIGPIYDQIPCKQRFRIVSPELVEPLEALVASGANTTCAPAGETIHPLFVEAYEHMRMLVDRKDKAVVCDDGTVDRLILLR